MRKLAARLVVLVLALSGPVLAQGGQDEAKPTAWTESVQPLDLVEKVSMPPVDVQALKAEDEREALTGQKALRYAASMKVDIGPDTVGTWERVNDHTMLWRLRVHSGGARSLNFGFDRYFMPAGGRLFIYSPDGKHLYRPFTSEDNEAHGQLWTPPVFGEETVIEITISESLRPFLKLHLSTVNHDYRGIGRPDMEKSGACNIDTVCPISDPYNDQERAVAVISTGGSTFCTGSLVNNTANDAKPYFMTANHCGINAGNAASLVTFWNYFNSTCRPQGGGQSPPGDGSLSQFNTGSFFRAANSATDFTLVELDDAPLPAFNVFFAGWDRTAGQFNSPVAIHHPSTDEMRITFSTSMTESGGWPPVVPGDGSHIHAIWGANLGVTEPGSSGSPLYTAQGRFIGQLHGGPSACGAADLSDYYGRFSVSWTGGGTSATRLSDWLDPGNTGQLTLDGRNGCVAPTAPTGLAASATAPNTIELTWSALGGASGYNVFRAGGACPQTSYALIASNVAGTAFNDTTVSGGSTYSYVVRAVVAGCESLSSNCDDALATGACILPPTFAGLTSVTNAGTSSCALDLAWSAGTSNCGGTLKYNVYRSLTPGFTPGPSNLQQSCVTGTTFSDTTVLSGTPYYYVVRAEDGLTGGPGPCNGGNTEANLVERSAAAYGPTSSTVTDDVESGGGYWTTGGGTGTNLWNIVTTAAHSPTHAWFVADPATVTDQRLATIAAGNIPPGFTMSWWDRYNTETSSTLGLGYDGHVLEYSLNGNTWVDILAGTGPIPANPARITQNPYNATISPGFQSPLANRMAWSGDNLAFQEMRVNLADFAGQNVFFRFRFASDSSVSDAGVWIDDITFRAPGACGVESVAPFALAVDTAGNGVLQPNEAAVVVAPTWRNTGSGPIALTGAASNFTGPPGPTYTLDDATAAYGTIGVSANGSCSTGGDCYAVSVSGTRPAAHWDTTLLETVNPTATAKTWTLHVGDSFTDVPDTSLYYRFIETIFHRSITAGCGTGLYCPGSPTSREQMAVFVLVAEEGLGYNPPACTTPIFADVPASSPFCKFIEELSRRGVVSGCGGGNYCPQSDVTREQMAVFTLATLEGSGYLPPACGTPLFSDVPASSPFCRWIEELANRGVVTGCGGGNYCPTSPVLREQMGVFLTVTFALTLFGP